MGAPPTNKHLFAAGQACAEHAAWGAWRPGVGGFRPL